MLKKTHMFLKTLVFYKKINFENKIAKGVDFWLGNEVKKVEANKEIILSSGAIGSPQILQVSGIGNHEKLKNLGIETVHNLNGVGENLHPLGAFVGAERVRRRKLRVRQHRHHVPVATRERRK